MLLLEDDGRAVVLDVALAVSKIAVEFVDDGDGVQVVGAAVLVMVALVVDVFKAFKIVVLLLLATPVNSLGAESGSRRLLIAKTRCIVWSPILVKFVLYSPSPQVTVVCTVVGGLAAETSSANPSTIQATANHRIRLPVAHPELLLLLCPSLVPSRRPEGRRGLVARSRSCCSRPQETCDTPLSMVLRHSDRCATDAGAEQQRRPRQARGVVGTHAAASGGESGDGRLPPPPSPCTCRWAAARWASIAKPARHRPGRAAVAVSKKPKALVYSQIKPLLLRLLLLLHTTFRGREAARSGF